MNLRKALVLLAGAAFVFAACGSSSSARTGPDGALVKRSDIKIEVVTHGQAIDGFWGVVRNGVKAAASDMGVTVNYSAPATESDMVAMSQLIETAITKKPSGLVVSIPNPDALKTAITDAVKAGIPVISMNSGSDVFKSLGVLAHVGQTEYEAGLGAGTRFKDAGVKNAVCFNQEVGNQALTLRCNGFFDGLYGAGGADAHKSAVLTGHIADQPGMQATMSAAFTADPTIDGIMTLGPTVAVPALAAIAASANPAMHIATFDLSADILTAIKDGKMDFAIDQQQFIQGYLPIVMLTMYVETGNLMSGNGAGLVMTGPGFVTKANAANVITLAGKGLR